MPLGAPNDSTRAAATATDENALDDINSDNAHLIDITRTYASCNCPTTTLLIGSIIKVLIYIFSVLMPSALATRDLNGQDERRASSRSRKPPANNGGPVLVAGKQVPTTAGRTPAKAPSAAVPPKNGKKPPVKPTGPKANTVHKRKTKNANANANANVDTTNSNDADPIGDARSPTPPAASMIPAQSPPQPPVLPGLTFPTGSDNPVLPLAIDPQLLSVRNTPPPQQDVASRGQKRSSNAIDTEDPVEDGSRPDDPYAVIKALQGELFSFTSSFYMPLTFPISDQLDELRGSAPKRPRVGKEAMMEAARTVPRPKGVGKTGWSLLKEMGLDPESTDDKAFYNEIMVSSPTFVVLAFD